MPFKREQIEIHVTTQSHHIETRCRVMEQADNVICETRVSSTFEERGKTSGSPHIHNLASVMP